MRKTVILLLSLAMIASCNYRDKPVDKNGLFSSDYRLYQDTPAWELAKAVWDNDISKIDKEVRKNPQLLNYQEPKYGMSLLHMSSCNGQFKSFKELLRLGANPNIYDFTHCTSPIIRCCLDYRDNTKYVAELIKYGANVNDRECGKGRAPQKTEFTPIRAAAYSGNLRMVKLLVEKGANLNTQDNGLCTAIIQDHYDIALYLLEQGADCNGVIFKLEDGEHKWNYYIRDLVKDSEQEEVIKAKSINEVSGQYVQGYRFRQAKEYPQIVEILKKRGCM